MFWTGTGQTIPGYKFYYINNSNYEVVLSTSKTPPNVRILDSVIRIGDTIQFLDYTINDINADPFGAPDSNRSIKILFRDTVNKCLIFKGAVIDRVFDIRSQESYRPVELDQEFDCYYSITNNHYSKAGQCN
jgi:hypothetical protein